MRITDMQGVDLNVYRFDWDLTFAALVMHEDGTIYHQYGNRNAEGAESHLSMASMESLLRGALTGHRDYDDSDRKRRERGAPLTVESFPTMKRRIDQGKAPECFHCHFINQGIDEQAQESGTFDPIVAWRWPPGTIVGLDVDRDDQGVVDEVRKGSPAAKAGVAPGDRLVSLGGRSILTEGDVQWVLDGVPATGGRLPLVVRRGEREKRVTLKLGADWRVGSPDVLWRPTMWRLDPKPGFGGPMLTPEQKAARGIDADVSAFRVNYIVTWGPNADTGRRVQAAGLRKNDVVLSVAGKNDFESPHHFHAWFRLTRTEGEPVPFEILRGKERLTVTLWDRD